jgi:hypothetical protein
MSFAPRPSIPATRLWPVAHGMVAWFMAAARRRAGGVDELHEARDLLVYWERRARHLPRWALLRRREARAAARVWRARVADAERLRYGGGLLGAVTQYSAERRMPARLAHRGHQVLRLAAATAVTVALTLLLVFAAAIAVAVDTALSVL